MIRTIYQMFVESCFGKGIPLPTRILRFWAIVLGVGAGIIFRAFCR